MNSIPVIEASPFICVSVSNKEAKDKLYGIPFDTSLVANRFGDRPVKLYGFWESDQSYEKRLDAWQKEENKVLFTGWLCKDMFQFKELQNRGSKIIITVSETKYDVNYSGRKFEFPVLPDTVDDFITDLKRIGITLLWKPEIADIYGIDSVTSNTKIIDYYGWIKNLHPKDDDFIDPSKNLKDFLNGSST